MIEDKDVTYLTSDRPVNALSSVLKEVGYDIEDLYDEWEYFHDGEKKEEHKGLFKLGGKHEDKKEEEMHLGTSMSSQAVNELISFIQDNPSILKRTIMLDDRRFQVGYNSEEIRAFIPRNLRNLSDCKTDYYHSFEHVNKRL